MRQSTETEHGMKTATKNRSPQTKNIFAANVNQYLERNLSVIPLRECSKEPFLRNWTRFSKQRPTRDEIETWVSDHPSSNIGLCCGPASGVVVFDLDLDLTRKLHRQIYKKIKIYIPDSPIKKVGKKGFSLFFKDNGVRSRTISVKVPSGETINVADFLSAGRQTVLPPSLHPDTRKPYRWSETSLLATPVEDLPEFPIENLDKIESILKKLEAKPQGKNIVSGRNNALKSMAVAAIHKDKSDSDVVKELVKYDLANHGQPLFSDQSDSQMQNGTPEDNALKFVKNIRKSLDGADENKNQEIEIPFLSVKELFTKKTEPIVYLVDGLLQRGGLSLIAGKPKVGKSTLVKHLLAAIDRGDDFLGRTTKRGTSLYLALEEMESEVKDHFKILKVSSDSKIMVHATYVNDPQLIGLKKAIAAHEPQLVVIDTLFRYIVGVKDNNSYQQVNEALEPLRRLARDTDTHIMFIHHASKGLSLGTDSILGSTAIFATVDTGIVLAESGKNRIISSRQRYGKPITETVLLFNNDSKTFSLGGSRHQSEVRRVSKSILQCLKSRKTPLTEKQIEELVKCKTTFFRSAIRKLVSKNKLSKSGKGTKGDPFKYFSK